MVDFLHYDYMRCGYSIETPSPTYCCTFLVTEALLHCRVVIVAKLKKCRVPSCVQCRGTYSSEEGGGVVGRCDEVGGEVARAL